jgi:hypothetical protein
MKRNKNESENVNENERERGIFRKHTKQRKVLTLIYLKQFSTINYFSTLLSTGDECVDELVVLVE